MKPRASDGRQLLLPEAQARSVLLAEAVLEADAAHELVAGAERQDALRQAVASARARGVDWPGPGDVLVPRAQALLAHAGARAPRIAALDAGDNRWRWLARVLPLAVLLAGVAADRIANAHRVDLLSPPLLAVLGWNLLAYLLLAARALHRHLRPRATADGTTAAGIGPAPGNASGPAAGIASSLLAALARLGAPRRGLAGRVAAQFHARWLAHTAPLQATRLARVLHLCAAAAGAGLALSLLLRGLVVRYQFGWESTFLNAEQVHAIARVLFLPLTALAGLEPFSLAEVAAAQDFAGSGAAGARWVWMYVGLLALVVMLPRLLLAAWCRWREARLAARCALSMGAAAWTALRDTLPARVRLGVVGADASGAAGLAQLLALHADPAAFDQLHAVPAADAGASAEPVEAVLQPWEPVPEAQWPAAWRDAPLLTLPWRDWGASWPLEPALPERLVPVLPERAAALARLRDAWQAGNQQRFAHALELLARHLRACAAPPVGADAQEWRRRQLLQLEAALRALHRLPRAHPAPAPGREEAGLDMAGGPVTPTPTPGPAAGTAPAQPPALADARPAALPLRSVLGTSAGAAAGAAAGAKAGALIDLGLGGLSLGAGTALGALLGGATAWTLQGRQRRGAAAEAPQEGAAPDPLRASVQAACLLYLVLAHQLRLPPDALREQAEGWAAQLAPGIAARWPVLQAGLTQPAPPADPLAALLGELLQQVLPAGTTAAPPAPDAMA